MQLRLNFDLMFVFIYIIFLLRRLIVFKISFNNIFIYVFVGIIGIACEKDSVAPEEHTDADGFILEDKDGNELYKEFAGAIMTNNITLGAGEELELTVHFLDHDGKEITHEDDSDEHDHGNEESKLRIAEHNTNVAIIEFANHEEEHCDEIADQASCEVSDHCEWHADESACEPTEHDEEEHQGMEIHITGVAAGSTSFKLELMHGDHADYTSTNNVLVTITSSMQAQLCSQNICNCCLYASK